MSKDQTRIVERVMTRLKLKQLRLLVAVGQHLNIQNAARELNVSQPAATKMIQDLELDFEVRLFERTNRGVIPTSYGEALIRHGKIIFAQVSNAAQELDDLNEGNSGRVVVGTLLAASSMLLPRAVEIILTQRPNVVIKIVEGTNEMLMPKVRSGEIDLVVGRLPTHRHRKELHQEKLLEEKILAVVRPDHPLNQTDRSLRFKDLKPFGWVLPPIETSLRRQLDQYFLRQDGHFPAHSVESVSFLTNRSLLQMRDFIGLMPVQVAAQDIASGTLAQLRWDVPFGEGFIGVTHREQGQMSPAAITFLEALRVVSESMTSSDI